MTETKGSTTARVYDDVNELPDGLLAACRPMPLPTGLLMCAPDEFDVIDVKNPHMEGHVGRVDRSAARRQWRDLKGVFETCGARVCLVDSVPEREDMVFCANQTFVGLDGTGAPLCVTSRMLHPSRMLEVPAFEAWFRDTGYRTVALPGTETFEGGGDAVWHPGRGLIWGGYGIRTEASIYDALAEAFDVPVVRLELHSERFYHLDTCFCALDERTVLIDPRSLTDAGRALVAALFERVIEAPPVEAEEGMACNAAAVGDGHVVIQRGNPETVSRLAELGFTVHEVETGEFLKSGGSVYCMKMYLFD